MRRQWLKRERSHFFMSVQGLYGTSKLLNLIVANISEHTIHTKDSHQIPHEWCVYWNEQKKYSLTKKNSNKKIAEIFKSSKNQRKFAKIETEKEIECIDVKSVESEINLNGSYNCCYWTFFLIQCLVSRYLSAALLLDKKWQSTSKNRTKTKLNGMKWIAYQLKLM